MNININYNEDLTETLNKSKYTETTYKSNIQPEKKQKQKFNSLVSCIMTTNDYNFIYDKSNHLIDKIKIKLCSDLYEKSVECYDIYKFKKSFTKKLIEKGFSNKDSISSIIYLSDLYKINIVCLFDNLFYKFIKTNKYTNTQVYLFDNGWMLTEKTPKNCILFNKENINDMFYDDLKGNYKVYQTYLENITKYKLNELQQIAIDNNISIKINNKNKKKADLYDEINDKLHS